MPTITAAGVEDLPILLGLLATLDGDGEPPMALDAAEAVFARMRGYPDYTVWLLHDDARSAIGTYSLLIMDNLGHRGTPSAIVENVAVAPVARGQGAGTLMMHHAMEYARSRGCYKLMLSSNIVRERAHAFYDRLGFQRHGISFRVDLEGETPR